MYSMLVSERKRERKEKGREGRKDKRGKEGGKEVEGNGVQKTGAKEVRSSHAVSFLWMTLESNTLELVSFHL